MASSKEILPYDEGTCFLVPLAGGLFCRGVVSRHSGKAAVFGYFFARPLPKFNISDFSNLRVNDAIERLQFGDYALITGSWPIVGSLDHWNREEWPLPDFYKECPLTGRIYRVLYSDLDLSYLGETEIEDKDGLVSFGTHGYLSVEAILNKLLV